MSDVGLSSNIYRISNKYLDRLNRFLVEINYNPKDLSDEHISSVKDFLEKLTDIESKNFQIQMIYTVLDGHLKSKNLNTQEILIGLVNDFENNKYQETKSIENIEILAAALDKECDYAFSRIQGR